MCPGLNYAERQLQLILASLVRWFNWRVPQGGKPEELDMGEKYGRSSGGEGEVVAACSME